MYVYLKDLIVLNFLCIVLFSSFHCFCLSINIFLGGKNRQNNSQEVQLPIMWQLEKYLRCSCWSDLNRKAANSGHRQINRKRVIYYTWLHLLL